jgi:hypothetical protein
MKQYKSQNQSQKNFHSCVPLKGPKHKIFVAGIFTEIRPVWVGDLETRPKNLKSLCLGPYITLYFLGFLF